MRAAKEELAKDMNPPAPLHNLNITPDTDTVFDTRQAARLLNAEQERDEQRLVRSRRIRNVSTTAADCRRCVCSAHMALCLLTLSGFALLFLSYYVFAHVISW
ncbi:hypothetical protein Tcan_00208 [Toxocara canis]|uniref:Uncharacterized protein n=1 Tax=Toxocara canis TaxID=6265 RepID=A0A0B2UMQ1_TOXCA|nr:hypothetical protein Tcan_00208 [Toxocara canis]